MIALIASLLLLRIEAPENEVSCAHPVNANLNWDLVLINTFDAEPQHNTATDDHSLLLKGQGLLSAELAGLSEALSASGELTFGIRFRTDKLIAGRPPKLVASLQRKENPRAVVARLLQNGPSATVSFSFQPWQGSSTVMANRLNDRYHEVVLTYDGTVQTTYFDGVQIGTETTNIDALDASDGELILNLGKRVDRRWQPYIGEISAIVIGTESLSSSKVATVFSTTTKD